VRQIVVPVFVPHAGCPHDCSFCNQRTISGTQAPPSPRAAAQVFASARESLGERVRSAQLAFFGGSFTAIDPACRRALLEAARPFLGLDGFRSIRVSTRPDAVTPAILDELAAHGVDTVELGVQSMRDEVLARNRRGHTAADVERASALLRERGFRLGHQMMTGLPGDDDAGALATAERIIALGPDMVRIYPTLVLGGTLLEQWYRQGSYAPPPLEDTVALGARLLLRFAAAGIPVIRLGLHDEPGMEVTAGPHHPALRELCESRLLLEAALRRAEQARIPRGPLVLRVHPGCVSRMTGQRRANLHTLEGMGYAARVVPDEGVPPMEVKATGIGNE